MVCFTYTRLFNVFYSQNCVEQPFDSQAVFVTKNTTFMEEFAVNIREYTTELELRIGEFTMIML